MLSHGHSTTISNATAPISSSQHLSRLSHRQNDECIFDTSSTNTIRIVERTSRLLDSSSRESLCMSFSTAIAVVEKKTQEVLRQCAKALQKCRNPHHSVIFCCGWHLVRF
jgi:predicted Zn-dependent protease